VKRAGFKGLRVWEISKDLAVKIYKLADMENIRKDYGLRDQMRRASVSVPSNIAEGDERDSAKEAIRFFYIAKGSIAEIRTQLQIAYEVGYFSEQVFVDLDESYKALSFKLGSLIQVRKEGFLKKSSNL
jgi:four helix bundle protein